MITELQWDEYTGKQKWDVLVAMRGPDVKNSDTLKWFTTAVIRYHAENLFRIGGMINHHTPFVLGLINGCEYKPVGPRSWDLVHFFTHIMEAAALLQVPIYYVSSQTILEVMIRRNVEAVQYLIDHFQPTLHIQTKDVLTKELSYLKGEGS